MQSQTFNIALPKDLVKEADKLAKKEYRNRSELIRESLIRYIREKQKWESIFRSFETAAKEAGITSEKQINEMVREHRHGKKK